MKKILIFIFILSLLLTVITAAVGAPGDLDTIFAGTGYDIQDVTGAGAVDNAEAVAIQSDGCIVVAGSVENGINYDFGVLRYNPDGTLDTTFNGSGQVITDVSGIEGGNSFDDYARAVVIQADGSILVGGSANNGTDDVFAVVRYNPDGTLDNTFGGNGIVTTKISEMSPAIDQVTSLAVYQGGPYDGYIVAGGSAGDSFSSNFALARYEPSGTLDNTYFGEGFGYLTQFLGSNDKIFDIALDADDYIVAVGYATMTTDDQDVAVARFDTTGTLDSTFNSTGYRTEDAMGLYDAGRTVAIQDDGAIVVAGYGGNNMESDFLAMRLTSAGALDTTFGGSGFVLTDISGVQYDFGYDLALQADGRIVVAGTHSTSTETIGALVRYNTDGSLDTGFAGSGIVTTNFGGTGAVDGFYGLALQDDGKAVVAGRSNNDFLVARYEMFSSANSPPDTPTHVSPEPFQVFAPGTDVTLQASSFSDPEDDSHVSSYWRVARADIDHFYPVVGPFNHETTTELTSYTLSNDPLYPDQQLTEGLAYYWKVGYMDSGSGQYSWTEEPSELEVPPDVFVIGTRETSTSPPIEPGETAASYRMLSAHHIPDDPRAAAVIGDDLAGGYDPSQYRLGVYDCEQGAYQEYPDFMIYPGGAMWVLAREGLSIDITGVPVATGVDVETSLRYNPSTGNGWNMIGPPNDRSYLWSDIEVVEYDPNTGQVLYSEPIGFLAVDNPYIDTRLWEWSNGQYFTTSTMESGLGYWVRAKRPNLNLRFTVAGQVAWSNPGIMLAAAGARMKNLAGAVLGGSEAIAAGDDETPPAPMAALGSSDRNDSSVDVSCFITSIWK